MTKDGYAEEYRKRVIDICDRYNQFGPSDDGYQYFWIKDQGALSATVLRIIADELDRRNKDWDDQCKRDMSA